MKISACCIIKNEEKNLPAWLDGVRDIADEIIVADTGSTDNSLTLLSSLKNKYNLNLQIHHFKWIGDFAAAKNFAISKATGDWIIFTDADEYFIEKDRPKIRPTLEKLNADKSVIGLETPRVNIDLDDNNKVYSTYNVVRVFRRDKNLCYQGAIHEDLRYFGELIPRYVEANLTIYHTGYSKELIKVKQKRNNEILLKNKSLANDNNPVYYAYLANAFYNEGKYKDAEKNVKKSITLMKKKENNFLLQAYMLYIKIKESQKAPKKEVMEILEDGLKTIPNHPDLLTYKLISEMEEGHFNAIEPLAKEIIEKSKDKKLRGRYMNKIDANLPYIRQTLGMLYKSQGRTKEAKEELLEALKSYRYREKILQNLLSLYNDNENEALKILEEFYDKTLDNDFLKSVLKNFPNLYNAFYEDKSKNQDIVNSKKDMQTMKQSSKKAAKKPLKISACCIIKNEEKNLPAWIDGVRGIADEIIVVDTGSTDNSLILLNDLKSKYNLPLQSHFFKWVNDFSAAKNFAISKATGDWIMFLDADEYFIEEDRPKIRPLLETIGDDMKVIAIDAALINIDADNDNAPMSESSQIRIFRRLKGLLYTGAIHERLWRDDIDSKLILEMDLKIIHTGYSRDRLKAKLARNNEIILSAKEEFSDEGSRNFYLATAYMDKKDYGEALGYIIKAIEYMKTGYNYLIIVAYLKLMELKELTGASEGDIERVLDEALKAAPNHPELLIEKLKFFIKKGKYKEAESLATEILKGAEDKKLRRKYYNAIDGKLPFVRQVLEQTRGKAKSVKISACCIIKNEEKNLPAWIDGVKDIADEIIVVDTGSTDNSLTLLNDLKSKYNLPLQSHFFKWVNDFSAAKNFAISKATGDWIMFLDADEYFIEDDRPKIRPLLEKIGDDMSVISIDTPLINIDADKGNTIVSETTQIRIFRRIPDLLYTGVVHERLWYRGNNAVKILEMNLTIYHTGYSSSIVGEKLRRNNKIIRNTDNKFSNEGARYYYMTGAYLEEGNITEAEKCIKKAMELLKRDDDFFLVKGYSTYMDIEASMNADEREIDGILEDALKTVPNHPELLTIKFLRLLERGDFQEAKLTAKKIFAAEKNKELRKKYYNSIDAQLPYVHYGLGAIYITEGRREDAKTELLEALKSYRYRKNVLTDLLSLYEDDEAGALKLIEEHYDIDRDKDFLAKAFEERPRDNLYARFCKDKNGIDFMLAAGNAPDAVKRAASDFEAAKALNLPPEDYKATLKSSVMNLAICFFFLNAEDLGQTDEELSLLPPSVIAVILRFFGEELPPIEGEAASYRVLSKRADIVLPKALRERFSSIRIPK